MKKTEIKILLVIAIVAAGLIFFRLGRQDMMGDDAHYAFRSIGYFDYMSSNEQTTPIQWFGNRPSWSYLGFHDHPFLVFFIEHAFFKFFGISVVVSRLPAAFAALGTLFVLYFLARRLGGRRLAILATAALTLNNYFIWTGRIGLLESVFGVFAILGIWYLVQGFEEEKKFLQAGLFLGLALLSKYTLLFFLPAIAVFLLWRKRSVFRNKYFWLGLLILPLVATPIVVYNLQMYLHRGHFDVQFADIFRQSFNDWTKLQKRASGLSLHPGGLISTVAAGFSWPYFVLFSLAFLDALYRLFRRREAAQTLWELPFLILLSVSFFLMLLGSAARWLGVVAPYAALVVAFWIERLLGSRVYRFGWKYAIWIVGGAVSLFSLFYILNTNIFYKAVGSTNFYANFRVENYGYNQLDREMTKLLSGAATPPATQEAVRLWWFHSFDPKAILFPNYAAGDTKPFNSLIIYDSNTNWFPTLWVFERWKLYHRILIMTSEEFSKTINSNDYQVLNQLHLDGIYYIRSGAAVAASANISFPESNVILDGFLQNHIIPQIVYDDQHREAFYIYHGTFNK